ncbi:methionine-S-sulfoxide reductase [Paenibacillus marchantiophytorum]|uniref:Peptide methionine sulfoxide reductase MsrA n=1 Tax=Paenibacillus marchantiophytorum TaxID=1619310 RepID=A0ABQ1FF51_9BACL|nr:peptide-methionine (S)-S-oxide reductase [Paenibacillus marchantiophytorum]GGA10325.1 methionine-S-sulfoxide reductase [Paenibacillus marchantiophytorum]
MANIETITLGMGCFWSPDALFGQLPGVLRTRVGYAGGTSASPTYRNLGDHTETVEIDFDPQKIKLDEIVDVFWQHHNPLNINEYKGRQYLSLALFRDENQLNIILDAMKRREEQGLGRPETAVNPFRTFDLAEERHQKYYLKRFPDAISKASTLYPTEESLLNSTLAARLNGLAKGFTNLERVIVDIRTWPISLEEQQAITELIRRIKW